MSPEQLRALLLIAAVVAGAVLGIKASTSLSRARRRPGRRPGTGAGQRYGQVVLDRSRRGVRRVLAAAERRGLLARPGVRAAEAIEAAGLRGSLRPADLSALRAAAVLAAVAALPQMLATCGARAFPLAAGAWLTAAARAPAWWLRHRARSRATAMTAALPDALDLLAACLAAGLPLRRGMALVAEHGREPLAGEFATVAAETALGIPQTIALDGVRARNRSPELAAFVAAVSQSERHGVPLAPVIAAQALEARRVADRAVVERGARAGPKIQLIVAATFVPAALLAFGAVVLAAAARGALSLY